jgi:tRNA1(Val) A37 N6-methylase TrmN6
VLELGAGVGVASLCLETRVDCRILGVEIDTELAALANDNAARNGLGERVRFVAGDARTLCPAEVPFDQVFFNPPFHPASGQVSPVPERDRAMRDSDDMLAAFTRHAIALVKPSGAITLILRPDRFDAWRAGLDGEIKAIPLAPRHDVTPKRVIAILRPSLPRRLIARAPIFLHEGDGRPTGAAEDVLRHGAALV